MRHVGRIAGWKDDKGFGFVTPHDGGDRAFVHIKAFQAAARRPMEGDLISYTTQADAKGRLNAVGVRFAGQLADARKAARSGASTRIPRAAIGIGFLLFASWLMLMAILPAGLLLVYWLMSGITYIAYVLDKDAAGKAGRRRTPESTLHLFGLLCGWPGALVAQQRVRHKTVKMSFQWTFWFTVIANLVGVAALVHAGAVA